MDYSAPINPYLVHFSMVTSNLTIREPGKLIFLLSLWNKSPKRSVHLVVLYIFFACFVVIAFILQHECFSMVKGGAGAPRRTVSMHLSADQ